MINSDIREKYVAVAKGNLTQAGFLLAADLMHSDAFKQGYTTDNAIIAAIEVIGAEQIARQAVKKELRVAGLA